MHVLGRTMMAGLMAVSPAAARAHEAPTRWLYDPACCGGRDCRPIREEEVTPVPDGWQVRATGEIVGTQQVRHSPDGQFHRCSIDGREKSPTVCLYVPDQS